MHGIKRGIAGHTSDTDGTQSSAGLLDTILLLKIVGDAMGCLSERENQRDRERPSSYGTNLGADENLRTHLLAEQLVVLTLSLP